MEPILVKAVTLCRNFDSASIPSLELSIEGMAMLLDTFSSMSWCCANLGHSVRMCSLVSIVSLSQGQVIRYGERGRNEHWNSPVYACLVRHWMMQLKASLLFLRFLKWGVGLNEGFTLFAIAYLPTFGESFHSICHSFKMDDLAHCLLCETRRVRKNNAK